MKKRGFLNLLKATRIERTLPILAVILIPAAYSGSLPIKLFLLSLAMMFIYSASSIYNAHKDNDYELPKYYFFIILILFCLTLIVSFSDKVIFFASLTAIILGFIYNTMARFIPMGDALIAGITHFVLPLTASSLLVGIDLSFIYPCAVFSYFIAFCIGPVTNLKDIEKDKKRNYKSFVNSVKNPKAIATIFFSFSFLVLFLVFISFGVNNWMLLALVPIILTGFAVICQINKNCVRSALNITRFYLIFSFTLLIFILTPNFYILMAISCILAISLVILLFRRNSDGKI